MINFIIIVNWILIIIAIIIKSYKIINVKKIIKTNKRTRIRYCRKATFCLQKEMLIEWHSNRKYNKIKTINRNQWWKIISHTNFITFRSNASKSTNISFNWLQTQKIENPENLEIIYLRWRSQSYFKIYGFKSKSWNTRFAR